MVFDGEGMGKERFYQVRIETSCWSMLEFWVIYDGLFQFGV